MQILLTQYLLLFAVSELYEISFYFLIFCKCLDDVLLLLLTTFGGIHKIRGQLRREEVSQIITLLHKPYLISVHAGKGAVGGSKIPKNLITWFMDAPFANSIPTFPNTHIQQIAFFTRPDSLMKTGQSAFLQVCRI